MNHLVRLVRRCCVLREQGDAGGVAGLQQGEIAAAVREFRLVHGEEALPESKLEVMFATEERRVAEAAILSELLLPRLVGFSPATPSAGRSARSPAGAPTVAAAPLAGSGAAAIPDLLDAMLAAERHGRRPTADAKRES